MSTTVWILLVLLVIYVPLWFLVWKHPSALKHGFQKYGPVIKINTRFGLRFIERYGRYTRFWHVMGYIAQAVSFVLMLMMLYIMVMAVLNLPTTLSSGGVGVEYTLAIPGLNPILPFWFGLLGLIVAMVCHEMAHGLQSRANGIGVTHTGILYGVVPLGAFVEPDQADVEKASRRAKIDLYTAGITTNFFIAAVSFILFSTVMLGGISSPYEDNCAVYGVYDDGPAEDAGIPAGAIILDIDGEDFTYTSDYYTEERYAWHLGDVVTVHYRTEDEDDLYATMVWGVHVAKTVDDSPAQVIPKNAVISSITLDPSSSDPVTYYLYTAQAFSSFTGTTHPGEEAVVNYTYYDGFSYVHESVSLVLDKSGSKGYFGIYSTTAGMNLITPEIMLKTASDPLYGADGLTGYATTMLAFMAHPMSGFDPMPQSVQWWYGDQFYGFWTVCETLYWIFWLNIMLGITNALPAIPFDGGYVFLSWVDAALEKAGNKDAKAREEKAFAITKNVSSLMLFLYILVIMAAIM